MPYLYVKHPVKDEDRVNLKSQYKGFKFVDLRFKPEQLKDGDVVLGEDKPPKKARSIKRSDK